MVIYMGDPVQLILLVVIVVLTVLLVILGVQVFYILKELRNSLIKINKVLDDAGTISESISVPVSALSGFVTGVQSSSFVSVFKLLKNIFGKEEDHRKHKDSDE